MQSVEMEIDDQEVNLRTLILAAAHERGVDEGEGGTSDLPGVTSVAANDWYDVVEMLSMEILHDTDWDLSNRILDMPPEWKRDWARQHNIDSDYFTDIAPDPAPAELATMRVRLGAAYIALGVAKWVAH